MSTTTQSETKVSPIAATPEVNAKAVATHKEAAKHHEAAAKHHQDAAQHHEKGNHDKASESTLKAHGHHVLADEALKAHAKQHVAPEHK